MNICIRHLRKSFEGRVVLNNVALELTGSASYALSGPSGAGKTTFLRLLCGLERPDSGSISYSVSPVCSYAFQEARLFPHLTVRENLTVIGAERDPDELLQALDLADASGLYPDELSGGMKTRAGVARALVKEANLYLFDEPTGGQDAVHAAAVMKTIRRYTAGALRITVSHDISLFSSASEVLLKLENGEIHPCSSFSPNV